MANNVDNEKTKYEANDLVIVQKSDFPVLEAFPIDKLKSETYARIERLACWFVLRAPLSEITKLASPSLIELFSSSSEPKKGSRTENRLDFEKYFLIPLELDCTNFEFVYARLSMKGLLKAKNLDLNDESVFEDASERCVCFVGRNEAGNEDSCIESICRHIRNCFAHGRIAIKEHNDDPLIFLEDGLDPRKVNYGNSKQPGQKLEVRFRMVAHLSTLERWYDILLDDYAKRRNVCSDAPSTGKAI